MSGMQQHIRFPVAGEGHLAVRFPEVNPALSQDQEWCEVLDNGDWRRIRFHDYHEVYDVPGLYEALFHRTLKCDSPARVVGLLQEVLSEYGETPDHLRALDVGAGNGMVGSQLWHHRLEKIVGVDIIPQAKAAAERDRPYVYNDYLVTDLTKLPEDQEKQLRGFKFNLMTTVAALGFGDIPVEAFITGIDLTETPAWLAFNIKENFLYDTEHSPFAELIERLRLDRVIRIESYKRYQHRISVAGQPLYYVAVVARKLRDLPDAYRG